MSAGRGRTFSRRRWLGGASTALALPFLESLVPRQARAAEPPRRLLVFYVPNGLHMAGFTPSTAGPGYAPTPLLMPLAPLLGQVTVVSGLSNRPARPDGQGDHASGTAAFLTAVHPKKTEGADIANGISMDQVAAAQLGRFTRFPSLQLGTEPGAGAGSCDPGYSCAYARNISWSGPATPLAKLTSPQSVFDRLFQGFDPELSAAERDRRRRRRQSVLDHVRQQSEELKSRLSARDRLKLDEFGSGVRELETRLAASATGLTCSPRSRPEVQQDFPTQVRLLLDLMVLAFECDLTRVITFMLGNAVSNRSYSFLGVTGGHHEISHHQGNPANLAKLATIGTWEIAQLGYLLGRLGESREGGPSLLDSSAVFFSSEIEDGDTHSHDNLPVILAGRAGGAFQPGRHLVLTGQPSIANLFVSILGALGTPVERFGDSTGPLAGL